jgi:hypothetical protein
VTLLGLLALAAGCFSPSFKPEIACGVGGECPPGQTCGTDDRCHGPVDASVGDGDVVDAPDIDANVDATPVECVQDRDCATPPNLCLLPGTCDPLAHACVFPAVDCSGSADACNAGACEVASGNCIKQPINETQTCGATTCGDFGACEGFVDTCDSSGTQARTCTAFTCQAGLCTPTDSSDVQGCSRATENVTCSAPTVTGCGNCTGATNQGCGPGTQACACTSFACHGDVCTPSAVGCAQTCHVLQPGDYCGAQLCGSNGETFIDKCCSTSGTCSVFCSTCQ